MAKTYRVGSSQRAVNAVFRRLASWGRGPRYLHTLTVTGRTTGRARSVPVDVMEIEGVPHLVAPYGEVNWVRNLRVAKTATLRRGSRVRTYDAVELDPDEAVPVIREYIRKVPITKSYWDVSEDAAHDDVREDAKHHPVFRLSPR